MTSRLLPTSRTCYVKAKSATQTKLASYVVLLELCLKLKANRYSLILRRDIFGQISHFTHVRRNTTKLFFSNFDRTLLETAKRPLALVLCIDRGPGVLAKGVEKSKTRPRVFGVQWVKICKNANFQTTNANFQTPIFPPIVGRSPPFKNHMC